jgi:hypothetical protein
VSKQADFPNQKDDHTMSEIRKVTIRFPNDNETVAIFPPAATKAEEILNALKIPPYKAVILIIGGADSVDEKLKPQLIQLFSRGIARAAANASAAIVDGGTQSGVMEMMGQGVSDRGFQASLIGVAPAGLVTYPGAEANADTQLDPNHSHFVLVDGNAWGSELPTIFNMMKALTSKVPGVVILASGGANSRNELIHAVRQNLKVIVVEGSGGLADEVAAACKQKPTLPEDPVLAEIIADGRIELHLLTNSVKGAERLIIRELGGDDVLMQAWEHFADYDLNAKLQQKRFDRLQKSIIFIGLLGTALALIRQVAHGSAPPPTKWPVNYADFWWYVYYVLILVPITLTILISAANKFKQGNKWLLLRASAETIKREIFQYRARAAYYKEDGKLPSPEQRLSQKVEDVTRRTMQTEVNTSALKPYDKDQGFPPYMYASQGGDDGFSVLTPDRYVELRLGDQLNYFRKTALRLERQLKVFQWLILIIGGVGTFLAAINQQVWIALTTAAAAAITTYLGYRQTESSLMKYNQARTDLDNVKAWWTALSAEEQATQDNVDLLVDHTEQVLKSELDGWVQQMQNALAELRKDQPTPAQKATAEKEATQKAATEKAATEKATAEKAGTEKAAAEKAAAEKAANEKAAAEKAANDKG